MSKQGEIIEVCGKKVVVRYIEHLSPCPECVFYEEGCTCSEHCLKFDKGNGTGPYFVDAERQEEKDYKRLYEELVNSEWYKKYYQGASIGDSVAVEQPQEEETKPIQGDIASEADFEAEFERFLDDVEGVPRMYYCDEQIEWGKDIARHFAEWGAEHADKPIYEVSSRGKSAMGDKFVDWLQFANHAIWDWMVKTDWYKKLQDMSDELIVKIYLGKKRSKK